MRIAFKIGYDGSKFNGFAIQPDKKTVEGEIIKILKKTKIIESREKACFQYGARTDKGVSAIGNVISFNCKGNALKIMENLEDIWIFGYANVNEKFNPRHCKKKIYRYYLYDEGYNIEKMIETCSLFEGKHDFSNFARIDGRNPFRKIDKIKLKKRGNIIKIDFEGKSFLWNQIRRIMAVVIKAGEEKIEYEEIRNALNKKIKKSYGIAPAENLVLLDIKYDFNFIQTFSKKILIKHEFFTDILVLNRNK
ncbi:MAG TPA: tRNA pseudouridine(38-40) synthase TruA [Thermoplasmatales archaeon]|nr:tRNA pseudouridine(38-40) synthase TruA [Thermoplasmatales archaeon]